MVNIDYHKLIEKLIKLGYEETYLSDITFCPYLIIHKDFKTNKIPVYDNINDGFLNSLKSKCILIEDTTIDEFISHAITLKNDSVNNHSGLF